MLRNLSIKKKLALVLWSAALLAFALSAAGLVLYGNRTLERRARQIIEPYAQLISVWADMAATSENPAEAREILEALRANPQILEACIILGNGRTLASYSRSPDITARIETPQKEGVFVARDSVELVQKLKHGGQLHLAFDREQIKQQRQHALWIFAAGVLVLLAVTLGQLAVLQRTLTRPLAVLAEAVEHIRTQADYSRRVPTAGTDEIARLGQAFNAMMEAVQERKNDLQRLTNFQRAVLDNAANAVVTTAPDGVITSFNPAAERLLGYTAAELVGQATVERFHDPAELAQRAREFSEELGEAIPSGIEAVLARTRRNLSNEYEWTCIRKDGSRAPLLISITALRDESGGVTGFVGLVSDLTERKKAEAALKEKTDELDRYFTNALDLLCIADTDGYFRRLNPEWEKALGYPVDELVGKRFLDFLYSDDQEATRQAVSQLVEQKAVLSFTNRFHHKDGSYRWIEWRAFPADKLIYAVARDITERKHAEHVLLMFLHSIDQSSDAIFWMTREAGFSYVNEQACRSLGYTREELLRLRLWDIDPLFPKEQWNANWECYQKEKQGGSEMMETDIRRKDGSTFPAEVVSNHIWFGNEELHVAVVRDITERKQAIEQVRRLAAEQRTILNAITAGISFIQNRRLQWVNPAFSKIFGYEAWEIRGMNALPLYADAETYRRVGEEGYAKLALGIEYVTEVLLRKKDGSLFWGDMAGQAVNPQKPEEGSIWMVHDITERKRTERALRENEERLRLTLEATNQGLFDLNLQTGQAVVNNEYAQMLGYESDEVGFSSAWWREHLHPDDQENSLQILEECRQGRQLEYRLEYRLKTKDGKWRWIFSIGKVVEADADGRPMRLLGMHRDITESKQSEAVLEQTRLLLEAILDQSPVPIVVASVPDCVMRFANQAAADFLGVSDESMGAGMTLAEVKQRQSWRDFRPDGTPVDLLDMPLARAMRGEISQNEEYYVIRKDGTQRWELVSGTPVYNHDGELIAALIVFPDVTERKRAELALQESLSLLQATLESTADGILVVNREGKIAGHNQRFMDIWGLPAEVLATKDDEAALKFVLNQLKQPEAFLGKVRQLYAQPEDDSFDQLEFIDGRVIERYSRPQMVEGRPTGRVWSFRDITARRRAEEALQESELRFRTLFESMTEGVALHELIYNPAGVATDYRILDVNPAFCRQTGLLTEQARGRLATEAYGTASPPYLKEWTEVARTGKPIMFDTYFAPMQRHFHISAVATKFGHFATVFEDVTDRKRNETELRLKNEELGRFTYTVSHDLKSPLITIKGFTGALQQDLAAGRHERLAGDLKRISDATDKMSDLLNDLLELSRIGRIVNPPSDVSLTELVAEVVELMAGPIKERGVKVVVQPDLPVVRGDHRRLLEVFQNLIENSVRFMGEQRRPQIEIGMEDRESEPVFFVRDNGLGIEPRYHETVFGLFNKLDAKTEGTGIGLALVRRIIEVHGGRVWVESDGHNQGSTFNFTIPSNQTTRKAG